MHGYICRFAYWEKLCKSIENLFSTAKYFCSIELILFRFIAIPVAAAAADFFFVFFRACAYACLDKCIFHNTTQNKTNETRKISPRKRDRKSK